MEKLSMIIPTSKTSETQWLPYSDEALGKNGTLLCTTTWNSTSSHHFISSASLSLLLLLC